MKVKTFSNAKASRIINRNYDVPDVGYYFNLKQSVLSEDLSRTELLKLYQQDHKDKSFDIKSMVRTV